MVKRLFVSLLIIAAALSISAPAHATTLAAGPMGCANNGGGSFYCVASPRGGTGTYTSFVWKVKESGSTSTGTSITAIPELQSYCTVGKYYTVSVTVTDSAGATATSSLSRFWCGPFAD